MLRRLLLIDPGPAAALPQELLRPGADKAAASVVGLLKRLILQPLTLNEGPLVDWVPHLTAIPGRPLAGALLLDLPDGTCPAAVCARPCAQSESYTWAPAWLREGRPAHSLIVQAQPEQSWPDPFTPSDCSLPEPRPSPP